MNEKVKHDTNVGAGRDFRATLEGAIAGGKWMAAVWSRQADGSIKLDRTTSNFQRGDYAAASGLLIMDLAKDQLKAEDDKLPDTPLPRAYPVVGGEDDQQKRIVDLTKRIAEMESRVGSVPATMGDKRPKTYPFIPKAVSQSPVISDTPPVITHTPEETDKRFVSSCRCTICPDGDDKRKAVNECCDAIQNPDEDFDLLPDLNAQEKPDDENV